MKAKLDDALMRRAHRHLRRSNPELGDWLQGLRRCDLHRGRADLFDTLARSIISQQLSTQAAATISARVTALGDGARLRAQHIAVCDPDALRAAGLSNAKTRYVRHLAAAACAGELNFRALAQQPDEAVIAQLTALPGVGRWTAQMFLMFALKRPDVAATGDLGLQRGMQMLFGLDERPDAETFLALAEAWRPFRSVACWYLWRIAG